MNKIIVYQISEDDLFQFLRELNNENLSSKKEERFLKVNEVIELTGKARSTLWAWERKGYLVPSRIGKELRYLESDVIKLMSTKSNKQE
jgi:predicted DNA-binding transcriptional regulator AlpA